MIDPSREKLDLVGETLKKASAASDIGRLDATPSSGEEPKHAVEVDPDKVRRANDAVLNAVILDIHYFQAPK